MTDDPPFDWPPAFEDEAYRLIGQIIAAWSDVHGFIHTEISMLQTRIHVLRKRAQQGGFVEVPNFGSIRVIPDTKFRLRLKYYRRLVRALAQGDKAVLNQLDAATSDLSRLYEIRNDLAHSEIHIGSRLEEPKIELSSHEWTDRWRRAVERDDNYTRPPDIMKTFTLKDLEAHLHDMRQAFSALLHIEVPFSGLPEMPSPPWRQEHDKSLRD